jgi:hypothetical protein
MSNQLTTQGFSGATIVVLLSVAALAFLSVSVVEQRLEPHKKHALNDQRLDETKLSLEVLRQRRDEVQATLDSSTKPRTEIWTRFSDGEVDRYRLAALAERYELDRRIAELRIREGRLQKIVETQSTSWADRLADAALSDGTYTHAIYNAGSLSAILLGYLALAAAAVALLGLFTDITLNDLADFLRKTIGAAGAGALVAALAGATVVAAAAGVLPDVTPPSETGPPRPVDSPGAATDTPRGASSNPTVSILSPVDVTVLGPSTSFEVIAPTIDVGEVVRALRDIGQIKPQILVQSDPELAVALKALRRDVVTTVDQRVTQINSEVKNNVALIEHQTEMLQQNLNVVAQAQVDLRTTLHGDLQKLLVAMTNAGDSSRALEPLVRAAAANAGCEVEWERSLQQRNGVRRLGDLLAGFRKLPCKPDPKVPLALPATTLATGGVDVR